MADRTALYRHRAPKKLRFKQAYWCLAWIGALFASLAANADDWDHAHGDAGNTSFNDVLTAPAGAPSVTIAGLGLAPFPVGSGPVVGPDGTVYLAGRNSLQAWSPNGALKWQKSP